MESRVVRLGGTAESGFHGDNLRAGILAGEGRGDDLSG